MACLNQLCKGLSWMLGGQMKEYEERVCYFVEQFHRLDVQLVFFFDGPTCVAKLDEWKRRRYGSTELTVHALDRLSAGESLQTVESTTDSKTPPGLSWFTGQIVERLGCKVISAVVECDEEVAQYSWRNGCLAILSQDSDFAIYNCGRYWSTQYFDVDTMTTREYNRNELAKVLRISPDSLPLFATLMGNDLIPLDSLRPFHQHIRNGRRGPIAFYVSEFVDRYPSGQALTKFLRQIAQIVFNDERQWTVLNSSLETYHIDRQLLDPNLTTYRHDMNWERVLRLALDYHRTGAHGGFFNIIFLQNYFSSNVLEDYRMDDLPLSGECLLELRKIIYGLLLSEKPSPRRQILVKELVTGGPGSIENFTLVEPTPPVVRHPGLLALWNTKDTRLNRHRMELICSSVGFNVQLIYPVPRQYRILLLSLKYLLGEQIEVEQWEIEAVVATAVALPNYSPSDLSDIDVQQVDVRCIRFYSLIMRTCSIVRLLNFCCGSPIPAQYTLPSYYQDGKLFHDMYLCAEQNENFLDFTLSANARHHFNLVMNALYSTFPE